MNMPWADVLLCWLLRSAALSLLFVIPAWLLWVGIKRKRRWLIVAGTIWIFLSCALVAFDVDQHSGRHERMLDHGTTSEGREYVLFQVCKGKAYNVMLYVRDMDGKWMVYYVDLETWPWRHGGRLDFPGRQARVLCGGEPFRTIDLERSNTRPIYDDYPATMTAEEVFNSRRCDRNQKDQTK